MRFCVHTGYASAPEICASFISASQYAPLTSRTRISVAGCLCASSFKNSSACIARRPYACTTTPSAFGGSCRFSDSVASTTLRVSSSRRCSSASTKTHSGDAAPGTTDANFLARSSTHSRRESSSKRGDSEDSFTLICGDVTPEEAMACAASTSPQRWSWIRRN